MARKKVAPQLKLQEQQGQSGQKGPPTMNHDEAVSAIVTTASPCDGVFVTMLAGTMIIVVPFVFRRPTGLVPHNTRPRSVWLSGNLLGPSRDYADKLQIVL
jgi:hypothetical protein